MVNFRVVTYIDEINCLYSNAVGKTHTHRPIQISGNGNEENTGTAGQIQRFTSQLKV